MSGLEHHAKRIAVTLAIVFAGLAAVQTSEARVVRLVVEQRSSVVAGYAIRLTKTDADGIDLAGVHPMESRVPLKTSTGWKLRSAAHRGANLRVLIGSYFPFATTQAERLLSGDPRSNTGGIRLFESI